MLPREKALNYGIISLENNELLALIIKSGYKENNVFTIANNVIEKANGFNNLLSLTYEELTSIKGINKAKALEIMAILEISKRLCKVEVIKEEDINSPSKIIDYLRFNIGFSSQEEFLAIYLTNAGKIIKVEVLFKGTHNSSLIGVDELMRKALLYKASSIIVCHNHPSGNVAPSRADIEITERIKQAGLIMNIPLIDHIIVSKSSFYSFKQANIL